MHYVRFGATLLVLLSTAVAHAVPTSTKKGLVTAAHPLAAQVGARTLAQGGNAADALVATAFALGVLEPHSSGLGGGGFALLYEAKTGRIDILDFRETAPAATTTKLYETDGVYDENLSRYGGRAVGVPGAVAGYAEIVKKYGKLPLSRIIEPAAVLAQKGFPLAAAHRRVARWGKEVLARHPDLSKRFLYDGETLGQTLKQPAIAKLLRDIGKRGTKAFYEGKAADAIVRTVRDAGGVMTREDLSSYRVRALEPLVGSFRGHRVVTVPPPSAGGLTVLQTLAMMERTPAPKDSYNGVERLHLMVETWKRSFAARASFIGDPRHAPEVGTVLPKLLAPQTFDAWTKSITDRSTPSADISLAIDSLREGDDTSHLGAVDAEGNVALMTTTINAPFGAGLVVPEFGVVLNNELDDFSPPVGGNIYGLEGGRNNRIGPGRTPVSTMAPTLVFDGDRPWIAVGAAGGSTITTTIAQVILHVADDGMDIRTALASPRLHAQFKPETVRIESWGLDDMTRRALEARGHTLVVGGDWGNAQGIVIESDGTRTGAADPRGEGSAVAQDQLGALP